LSEILKTLKRANIDDCVSQLYGINVEQAKELSAEGLLVEPDRDDWDYVYLRTDLANLPGD